MPTDPDTSGAFSERGRHLVLCLKRITVIHLHVHVHAHVTYTNIIGWLHHILSETVHVASSVLSSECRSYTCTSNNKRMAKLLIHSLVYCDVVKRLI